jgi:hypothetical protein
MEQTNRNQNNDVVLIMERASPAVINTVLKDDQSN